MFGALPGPFFVVACISAPRFRLSFVEVAACFARYTRWPALQQPEANRRMRGRADECPH